jgi:hypothetical protein
MVAGIDHHVSLTADAKQTRGLIRLKPDDHGKSLRISEPTL